MDFSQLPKMSDTPKPPPVQTDADTSSPRSPQADHATDPRIAPPVMQYASHDPSAGFGLVSVWISLIVGVLLLMLGANFGRWATATLSGKAFSTGWVEADGVTPVSYFAVHSVAGRPETAGGTAWSDAGLFLMGIALLVDAGLMLLFYKRQRPSPAIVLAAIVFMGAATALNLFVSFKLFSYGLMPLMQMCAVLVGGMMLFDHVPLLRARSTRST